MAKSFTRKQLIELARQPAKLKKALASMRPEDRIQAELFLRYQLANEPPLSDAPIGWRTKAAELAAGSSRVGKTLVRLAATLTFDSWVAAPGGVREVASMEERRLRFEVEGVIVDIRAERRDRGWDFVAGIIQGVPPDVPISLSVGSKTVKPGETGALQWSSTRLPSTVVLHVGRTEIELPELSWK